MTRRLFYADTETYSTTDIRAGTDNYSRAAEVMIWTYASGNDPVQYYDVTEGGRMPDELEDNLLDERVTLVFHNAAFDRQAIATAGFRLPIERFYCTMAQALAHGLPGALDKLCDIFNIGEDKAKLKDGKALIQLFCKPRPKNMKLRRATRETHPDEWARFIQYAVNDIEAMREVHKLMPKWNYGFEGETAQRELKLWHIDQTINQRGVCIDVDLVNGALETADRVKIALASEAQDLSDYDAEAGTGLKATTQRDALLRLLRDEYDVELYDLRASTVERLLKSDVELPPVVVSLLQNRLSASSTSVSKYKSFAKLTGPDGRLRNTLQFCGAARTGRWAGRGVQLQNLPRPSLKQKVIDQGIVDVKLGVADLIYKNPMELLQSSVRGCIIASPDKKLCVADLSNIEGRMLAWLAGEEWKLQAFRDYDTCLGLDGNWYPGDAVRDAVLNGRPIMLERDKKGDPIRKGHDLYALAYAQAFGITAELVMENKSSGDGSMRQTGKVMELACLGPETLVATDHGAKRIVDVTTNDKLWDGQEWVKHKGLLSRGVRQVLDLAGLKVTPDHLVKVGPEWVEAEQLSTCESTLSLALATGSASWSPAGFDAAVEYAKGRNTYATSNERMQTYDIAYSGPRNCFTVLSDRGPLIVHNCGYQGSVGAYVTFALAYGTDLDAMAKQAESAIPKHIMAAAARSYAWAKDHSRDFGLPELTYCVCWSFVRLWRNAHSATEAFWGQLEMAFKRAVLTPGSIFTAGKVRVAKQGTWVRVVLPSGRCLCYPSPRLEGERESISYMGISQFSRQWWRLNTYGGKLAENVTQAASRDIIAGALPIIEDRGYEVASTVHDEDITEAPDDDFHSSDHLAALMSNNPHWAVGLPLAAAGFESTRYKKD